MKPELKSTGIIVNRSLLHKHHQPRCSVSWKHQRTLKGFTIHCGLKIVPSASPESVLEMQSQALPQTRWRRTCILTRSAGNFRKYEIEAKILFFRSFQSTGENTCKYRWLQNNVWVPWWEVYKLFQEDLPPGRLMEWVVLDRVILEEYRGIQKSR